MYDWQDKDGYGKLKKILQKLLDNGYNAKMSNSKQFVIVYDPEDNRVCEAYSSSWHDVGLIEVCQSVQKIGSTFNADKAYEMLVDFYNKRVLC